MATRICPHCGLEKDTRGFHIHEITCGNTMRFEALKKRYAKQIATMTPEQSARFLRKAGG